MEPPKGLGQYDLEYGRCDCFWGEKPGKFVELLLDHLEEGTVLDLGAGEGKNSIFLARKGFRVKAVECSSPAITNFRRRLDGLPPEVGDRIEIARADVREFRSELKYDAVIAYGLLHCLPSASDARRVVRRMKKLTSEGGFDAIATFTPKLPVPAVQSYLEPTFVETSQLVAWYRDWRVVRCEEETISETHPTSGVPHQHSVCRLLTQNL